MTGYESSYLCCQLIMALLNISGSYNSDHEVQGLFPLVPAAGQKLLVFVLSHFFSALLDNASQMLILLSFYYSPEEVSSRR